MASSSSSSLQPPASAGKQAGKKPVLPSAAAANPLERVKTYLFGVKAEWTKITWPTPVQLWGQILIVVAMVTLMTLVLWAIDNTFRFGVQAITHRL